MLSVTTPASRPMMTSTTMISTSENARQRVRRMRATGSLLPVPRAWGVFLAPVAGRWSMALAASCQWHRLRVCSEDIAGLQNGKDCGKRDGADHARQQENQDRFEHRGQALGGR